MFEDVEPTAQGLKNYFAYALWSWANFYTEFEF